MRSMMFCTVRRPIVNNTIARRPGRRTISDQALVLSLVSLSLYIFLARSARPQGSEVNGTAAPWSVLLASCKRVCWPWNQWKYFMDGGRYAYTRTRIRTYTRTRSLYACMYTSFYVSYTTVGSFRDDRARWRTQNWAFVLFVWRTPGRPIQPFWSRRTGRKGRKSQYASHALFVTHLSRDQARPGFSGTFPILQPDSDVASIKQSPMVFVEIIEFFARWFLSLLISYSIISDLILRHCSEFNNFLT